MGFLHELVGEGFSIQPVLLMNPDAAALRGWCTISPNCRRRSRADATNSNRWPRSLFPELPVNSPIWTATLIGAVGDVSRFSNVNQFKAYLGWCPQLTRSGSPVGNSELAKTAFDRRATSWAR